jgi:hypothetical protein
LMINLAAALEPLYHCIPDTYVQPEYTAAYHCTEGG